MDWIECRKKSGMSQFRCAQSSGISRMRLSLAETGQIALTLDEEQALQRALGDYITGKVREINQLLQVGSLGSSESQTKAIPDASANSFPEFGKLAKESYRVD